MDANSSRCDDVGLLRAVTTAAAGVFAEQARRRAADAYLRQRDIDASGLSSQWLLGFAPPGWTRLVDRLRAEFSDQALLEAGVARRSSRGTLIDTFRDRVIFGIRDTDGTVAGFIGRDLSGHPNAPKYLNTRRHPLFDKGALLFGLCEGTRAEVSRQPVVVEGPLDVLAIAARQPTSPACDLLPVAPCGTAITAVQARLIADVAAEGRSSVVVAMDGDSAGRTAALAAGEHLRHAGVDVRIAMLPNGLDPAEHLLRPDGDIDSFRPDHAMPLINARIEDAIAQRGDLMQWPEGRIGALRTITRYLATYPPDVGARQIPGVAAALDLPCMDVTRELAEAYVEPMPARRGAARSGLAMRL